MLRDLDRFRAALQSAEGLDLVLAASWDAFDVLAGECEHSHDDSLGVRVSLAFAGVAAAEGRMILSGVTALPAGRRTLRPSGGPALPSAPAGALCSLAGLLHQRLTQALDLPGDPGDQASCAHAAIQAALVHKLLAGEP